MLTDKVIQAISKVKEIPEAEIKTESSFEELGVDSLDAIEILFELEEEYDISIPTEKLQGLEKVQDVVDGVQKLLDGEGTDSTDAQASA